MKTDDVRRALEVVRGGPFPTLGDPAKLYPVKLTEPEINAIHAGMGFIRAVCADWPDELAARYWKHYGPTLEALSNRLIEFDDEPTAPATPGTPNPQDQTTKKENS